jgi:hypothetical protein
MARLDDLIEFYCLLGSIEVRCGGKRRLSECHGRMDWPRRGVYFFFEEGEQRSDSGTGPRVVRVGTHALKTASRTTLWNRLSQHRGNANGEGGNHRGSIFRLLVGNAIRTRDALGGLESWGVGGAPGVAATRLGITRETVKECEAGLERIVCEVIGHMSFLWLAIDDAPGRESLRGYVERNAIALLSNHEKCPLDRPSGTWLGHNCDRTRVQQSGLWNNNHVDEAYDPGFLKEMDALIRQLR